jgi:transcriptional regulator with XRE-family HTH domain
LGRHRLSYHWLWYRHRPIMSSNATPLPDQDRWELFYRTPYSEMVGARLRRLRTGREFTQAKLLETVKHPRGASYSKGLLSRIEKGYANSPLYVYVHLAAALDLEPGRLMGSDETQKPISEAEMTLVRFLRRTAIKPDEAIAWLASRRFSA